MNFIQHINCTAIQVIDTVKNQDDQFEISSLFTGKFMYFVFKIARIHKIQLRIEPDDQDLFFNDQIIKSFYISIEICIGNPP